MVHLVNKWDFSTTLSVSVFQNYLLERHQSLLSLEAGGGGCGFFGGIIWFQGKRRVNHLSPTECQNVGL